MIKEGSSPITLYKFGRQALADPGNIQDNSARASFPHFILVPPYLPSLSLHFE